MHSPQTSFHPKPPSSSSYTTLTHRIYIVCLCHSNERTDKYNLLTWYVKKHSWLVGNDISTVLCQPSTNMHTVSFFFLLSRSLFDAVPCTYISQPANIIFLSSYHFIIIIYIWLESSTSGTGRGNKKKRRIKLFIPKAYNNTTDIEKYVRIFVIL